MNIFNELTEVEFASLKEKLIEKLKQIKSFEYDLEENNFYDPYMSKIKLTCLEYFESYFKVLRDNFFKINDEQLSEVPFTDIMSSIDATLDSIKNTIIELYKKSMSLLYSESSVANKIQKEDFEYELENFHRELDKKKKSFQIDFNNKASIHKKHVDKEVFLRRLSISSQKATIDSARSSWVSAISACVSIIVSVYK